MEITYSKEAIKFLKTQNKSTQIRIVKAINKLPNVGDIKKLQDRSGYRLRVGTYRIIFDNNGVIIHIIDIGNRGQIYRAIRR